MADDRWVWVLLAASLVVMVLLAGLCGGCAGGAWVKPEGTPWAGWESASITVQVDKEGAVWLAPTTTIRVLGYPVTVSGAFAYDGSEASGQMCMDLSDWIKPLCVQLPFGGTKNEVAP